MKHTIAVLVENHFGVLSRVSGLFSGRGFNIDSLAVGETEDPTVSRMTIVVKGDDRTLEQVKKQLNKLIEVIKVIDLTEKPYIDRELLLIKVNLTPKTRSQIIEVAELLGAKTISVGSKSISFEVVGESNHVENAINLLGPFGVKEVVRTGRIAISRDETEAPSDTKKDSTS